MGVKFGPIDDNECARRQVPQKCQGLSEKYKPCSCIYDNGDHQDYDTFECGDIVGIGFGGGLISGARDKFDNEEGGGYTDWDDSDSQGSSTPKYLFSVNRKREVPPCTMNRTEDGAQDQQEADVEATGISMLWNVVSGDVCGICREGSRFLREHY